MVVTELFLSYLEEELDALYEAGKEG